MLEFLRGLRHTVGEKEEENPSRQNYIALRVRLTNEDNTDFFGKEYDKLQIDPRVLTLQVSRLGLIVLETRPIYPIGGELFFIAHYNVRIEPPREESQHPIPSTLTITCMESGRRDGTPPLYNNNQGVGGFCFGIRNDLVKQLLKRHELFQLVLTVLESLWHVNKGASVQVSSYYRRVINGGVEPYSRPKTVSAIVASGTMN